MSFPCQPDRSREPFCYTASTAASRVAMAAPKQEPHVR